MPLLALVTYLLSYLFSSVYRTIELADGWNGTVITTQVYFSTSPAHSNLSVLCQLTYQTDYLTDVFDGAMITLAMYTLNIFHPGFLLPQPTLTQKKTASEVPLSSFNYQAV